MLSVGAIVIISLVIVLCIVILALSSIAKSKKEKLDIIKKNNSFLNLCDKTNKQKIKTQIATCESCGAVIQTVAGKADCPYCGAKYSKK